MGLQGQKMGKVANSEECQGQNRHGREVCGEKGVWLKGETHTDWRDDSSSRSSQATKFPSPASSAIGFRSAGLLAFNQPARAHSASPITDQLGHPLVRRPLLRRVPSWKRPVDVILSLILLVLLAPLWVLVALAVKLTSPGPVLYRQERVGLLMRRFQMFKFRTMFVDADEAVHRQLVEKEIGRGVAMKKLDAEQDNRVTPVGRFLRPTSLDELPQLLNVLRGEMSLVGPRPCLDYELKAYKPWYVYRFECLPGMTGLWQVCGKNRLTADQMARLDIHYARRQTLGGDFRIMLQTPRVVWQEMLAACQRWQQRRRAARRGQTLPGPVPKRVVPSLSDSV